MRVRSIVLGVGLAGTLLSCAAVPDAPEVTFVTNDFDVGETYTFGMLSLPAEAVPPLEILEVELVKSRGIEVLGVHAVASSAEGIGLVPGWEPGITFSQAHAIGPDGTVVDFDAPQILVGVTTREPVSGFRGLRVRWKGGDGETHQHVADSAVVTCAPGACPAGADEEWILTELGLSD